ncbi:ABC transporter ATP-binding protein [Methanobrevibacter sp. DSM 116169]|uniref:ABC transporter ATP-binding protein n=1 Tax=Methanobrevibacter sp. DSM 116169 TaxID=3242727 RepID=UPI0038FC0E96
MTIQVRYPNEVYEKKEKNTQKSWDNLENIKLDDWQSLASVDLTISENTPAPIYVKKFNFNIPSDAAIENIQIEHDYHREQSQDPIEIEAPIIKISANGEYLEQKSHLDAGIFPTERNLVFEGEDLSANDINGEDFKVEIIFPENTKVNSGTLYLDFIRLKVQYETKRYLLTSGETSQYFPHEKNPLEKAIGDTFKYTLSFRNVNGISNDKQKVELNLPDGIEIEKYYYKASKVNKLDEVDDFIEAKDEFDDKNLIWYPSVRGKGVSRIRFIFKCTKPGLKKLFAFNENTEITPNFYVNIHSENFEAKEDKYEETMNKWSSELEDDEEFVALNQNLAIKTNNISMEFEMAQEKVDNLKEYVIKGLKRELKPKTNFKALTDVSFTINKGERVGIIGFNGAGKSTVLKILSGVLKPTEGELDIQGKIAPLLELGAGFDHNYSGRENIFLNGAILGYSKEFLESKYDEIVEFSELGEFIDTPIKNYSSGMNAKLGFSIATIVEPDILILDEILSVGDVRFQKKSGDKLKEMMGSGTTVLLVSHSTAKIRELCNRVIWLDKGKVVMDGDTDYVCDAYIEAAEKASEDEKMNLEFS